MIATLLQTIFDFIESIFQFIFGDFNPYILFSWCPADIQTAVRLLIVILFSLALMKFLRAFLPF